MRKVIEVATKVICFICCLIVANKVIEYCVYEETSYKTMEELYNEEENIDVLLLGSSHTDVSFCEEMLEKELGKNIFNAGTPVQKPDVSYYILKETIKSHKIDTVYMDMFYYMYHDEPEMRTPTQLEFVYLVSDNMRWSMDKIRFLFECSTPKYYLYNFIKSSRGGTDLFNLEYVEENIKKKRHTDNNIYSIIENTQENSNKTDFRYQMEITEPFCEKNISDYSRKYITKIAELCKKENIKLVLIVTPMTDFQLSIFGNYDLYINEVKSLAEQLEVLYYDYNLCRTEILGLNDECFSDLHHLNSKGAEQFTKQFIKLEKKEISYRDAFYSCYEEKIRNMEAVCMGIEIIWDEHLQKYIINPICTRQDMQLQYEINLLDKEKTKIMIDSEDASFFIDKNKKFSIVVIDAESGKELRYYELCFE